MREVKITLKNGCLVGSHWHAHGDLVHVDDHRAAKLVELGHAVHVHQVAVPPDQLSQLPTEERATDPRARRRERRGG